MANRFKIATRLPEQLCQMINMGVIKNGYSMKQKYIWVSDAIEEMVKVDNYIENLVEPVLISSKKGKYEIYSITEEANEVLLEVEAKVKKEFNINRGAKSAAIRAALFHKAIKES